MSHVWYLKKKKNISKEVFKPITVSLGQNLFITWKILQVNDFEK